MDIKEYISSGRLEEYILGSLSEQEMQEVECMVSIYPELKEELEGMQVAFEKYLHQYAVNPPSNLKEKIYQQVKKEPEISLSEVSESEFIGGKQKKLNVARILSVAASIVLLLSLIFIYRLANQNNRLEANLDDLEIRFERLTETYQETVEENEKLAFKARVLSDPAYKVIPMEGVEDYASSMAYVYWDTNTKDVYVGIDQLPLPPEDKQYQLWAIVDGKAVDAGVFEVSDDTTGLQKMKNIQRAEAFVVTLEKRGGVPVAEGDIYVMGNV